MHCWLGSSKLHFLYITNQVTIIIKDMNYEFEQTNLSRCLLAGVLAGVTSVAINIMLIFCFGISTVEPGYSLIINPFTVFLGGIIPTFVGALFYSFFSRAKSRNIIYTVIFGLLTFISVKMSYHLHLKSQSAEIPFHQILLSMIIITGSFTTFIIPFIINNKKLQRILF
jgi:hypothetical protein